MESCLKATSFCGVNRRAADTSGSIIEGWNDSSSLARPQRARKRMFKVILRELCLLCKVGGNEAVAAVEAVGNRRLAAHFRGFLLVGAADARNGNVQRKHRVNAACERDLHRPAQLAARSDPWRARNRTRGCRRTFDKAIAGVSRSHLGCEPWPFPSPVSCPSRSDAGLVASGANVVVQDSAMLDMDVVSRRRERILLCHRV